MIQRVPLAWLNLTHDRRRFATSLVGVGFAVLMMFVFSGFMNALFDSQLQLINRLNGEVIMINPLRTNVSVPQTFARRRLYQARAFEGVQNAYALYISEVNWENPETHQANSVRVTALNPDESVLTIPEIDSYRQQLRLPETALMDTRSRPAVGPVAIGVISELAARRIRLVGTFTMGTDFSSGNGNLIMSDQNFLRYFADRGPDEDQRSFATVDIGVIKLEPGANVERIVETLQESLPNDVLVMARDGDNGFIMREQQYWEENSLIGFIFSLLTSMSFLVGVILVYQILYTDVADHWSEYATLKAMGYRNDYLLKVVIQEALILSVLGFIPGFLVSQLFYTMAINATGLFFQMTSERVMNLLITTFIMCLVSGAIAVRKVQTTDPADVF